MSSGVPREHGHLNKCTHTRYTVRESPGGGEIYDVDRHPNRPLVATPINLLRRLLET